MCGVDGKTESKTLAELKALTLAGTDEHIPSFREVLDLVDGRAPLIVEIKGSKIKDARVCELTAQMLDGYNGVYCIESFHPFAVKWYREHRPDVIRGQLSQDFSKTDYKGIQYWAMTHLLLNFLTRPDFIAYNHKDADIFSRRLCAQLGALSVAWTIKNRKQYEDAKPYFDLVIFDSFIL
jgi:glycerophosphoryl diester phosphodiesterase